uniref:beta strand repeat-containing protein n=1 Tax=Rhizobium sp. TaxID=391 RepID=UPI0028AA728A
TVTVEGRNDKPIFEIADNVSAAVIEDTKPTETGTINFIDVDLTDTHTVSVTSPQGALGSLVLGAVNESSLTAGGSVEWTYKLNEAAQALKAGEIRTETYTVSISDGHGGVISKDVTVTITGTNDAPTAIALSANTINENKFGATIGHLTTTDKDVGDTHTYTVSDDRFEVVNGDLKLKQGVSLDYETAHTVTVSVTSTDSGNLTTSQDFTIQVGDVNEAPTGVTFGSVVNSIDENINVGTGIKVAVLGATDDALGQNSFSLTGADASSFQIRNGNELYYVGSSPDFETKSSYSVNVNVNDPNVGGDVDASKQFTLNVNDLPEAPLAALQAGPQYAFTDGRSGQYPAGEPTSIRLDLASLFSGATAATTYSYEVVRQGNGTTNNGWDNWLTRTGNVLSGDPDTNRDGLYILKVTATNAGVSTSTYVAITAIEDGGTKYSDDTLWDGDGDLYTGVNNLSAGGGDDVIIGLKSSANTLIGGSGSDQIYGGDKDDTIVGGSVGVFNEVYLDASKDSNFISAGAGNDTIYSGGRDYIFAGSGDDRIYGFDTDKIIDGGTGTNTLMVAGGFDSSSDGQIVNIQNVIMTTSGTLDLSKQTEGFTVTGSSGNDMIIGGSGADSLFGGAGNDAIYGAQNDVVLNGGAGNDTLYVAGGFISTSDAQIDQIESVVMTSSGKLDLSNQTERLTITGTSGNDVITASSGGGTVNVGTGNDVVVIDARGSSNDSWTVNLSSNGADTIVFKHNGVASSENTVADVYGFGSGDKIAVVLGTTDIAGSSNPAATYQTIQSTSSGGTTVSSGIKVIELQNSSFVASSLTTDTNSGSVASRIADAIGNIKAGYYTIVVYSSTNTSTADAGIYTLHVTGDANNLTSSQFTLEHIMTLHNVGYGSLTSSNFAPAPNAIDPIILDLDHNGIALTSLEHGVSFDINADGHQDKIAWTAGTDGILAYDVDGNGKIDNGSEIFSPHFAGGNYVDGLQALATLDSNHDGKIDASDEAFSKLTIWQDLNHNGISDAGELSSLADHQIASLSLDAHASDSAINGQAILADGSYTLTDGSTGHFVEVAFDATLGSADDNHAYSLVGSDGNDTLSGAGGMYTLTGGAGADTFVLDADALSDVKIADVITDYKAREGDTLDVSKLLDSLLGHQATEAEALSSVKTTVQGADTVVSVNANGGWHDVAVLQNTTEAVKILFDDKHDTTTAPHVG